MLQIRVVRITNASSTNEMVQNLMSGKNKLWTAYQDAGPLVKAEIVLELKKAGLFRHWYTVACKDKHDLKMAKAPLRDIFLKVMPETAPLFGIQLRAPDSPSVLTNA